MPEKKKIVEDDEDESEDDDEDFDEDGDSDADDDHALIGASDDENANKKEDEALTPALEEKSNPTETSPSLTTAPPAEEENPKISEEATNEEEEQEKVVVPKLQTRGSLADLGKATQKLERGSSFASLSPSPSPSPSSPQVLRQSGSGSGSGIFSSPAPSRLSKTPEELEAELMARLEELKKKDQALSLQAEELQAKIAQRRSELIEIPTLPLATAKVTINLSGNSGERATGRRTRRTPRSARGKTPRVNNSGEPIEEEDDGAYDESDDEDDNAFWDDEDGEDEFDRLHEERKRMEEETARKALEKKQKEEEEERLRKKKQEEAEAEQKRLQEEEKEEARKQLEAEEEKRKQQLQSPSDTSSSPTLSSTEATSATAAASLSAPSLTSVPPRGAGDIEKLHFKLQLNASGSLSADQISPRTRSPRSFSAALPKIPKEDIDSDVKITTTVEHLAPVIVSAELSPRKKVRPKSVEPPGVLKAPEDEPPILLETGDDLPAEVRLRNKVINEIIQTERDYINDIKLTLRLFRDPLREGELVSEKDINLIFGNMQLLLGVNQELLRDLHKQATAPTGPMIGSSFSNLADYLKMYSSYCSAHHGSLEHLETVTKKSSKLNNFLQERLGNPECRGLPLSSYLIKPVQRICKYPLLLRELIKYTPNSHADHTKLEDAFSKINSVVLEVNESQRANESRKKIIELQNKLEGVELFGQLVSPSRLFLKEGNLTEINSETGTAFYFLFNDLLVRAVPRNRSKLVSLLKQRKEDMLTISAWITNLPKLEVNALNDTPSYKNIFEMKDNINKFMVSCNTPAERDEWLAAFATAKESFVDSDGTKKGQKNLTKTQSVRMVSLKKKKGNM